MCGNVIEGVKTRDLTEGVSNEIQGTLFVMECGAEFFEEASRAAECQSGIVAKRPLAKSVSMEQSIAVISTGK